MARSWDTRKDQEARDDGSNTPNTDELLKAVDTMSKWTVGDVIMEAGGTRNVAESMLRARGVEIDKKSLASQMRSINRWLAAETGSGSQARKPSKDSQKLINRIGRNAQASRDGFFVAMSGDISVDNYRRGSRTANIHMQGDAAAAFLDNPTFAGLSGSDNYGGLAIEAFGDVKISIDL
jgi:hypothetical protein